MKTIVTRSFASILFLVFITLDPIVRPIQAARAAAQGGTR
jgi:hypothetical protein